MIAPDTAARVCVDGGIPKGVDHEKGDGVIPEPGVHKSTVFFRASILSSQVRVMQVCIVFTSSTKVYFAIN